ncbi:MAG: transcriptional repressor [Tepidanaerobacteraceae bacterium]|nr:transcriptional repressor [Tepidanaerobacteraceae bacterium]
MSIDEMLKQKQLKVTPQRKAILTVLERSETVLSAQDLFREVLELLPGTNFSTIYRNLDILLSKGILCRIHREYGGDLYEIRRQEGHHHHVICKACGASYTLDFCPMEALGRELQKQGFTPTEHRFEVYGYCDKCRKS